MNSTYSDIAAFTHNVADVESDEGVLGEVEVAAHGEARGSLPGINLQCSQSRQWLLLLAVHSLPCLTWSLFLRLLR